MADSQRTEELAFGYCLRRLTAAPRTEHDLRTKLSERGYEGAVIDGVLGRLRRAGYVDDAEFARSWVRSRSQTKSLAAPALRRELRAKGVADDLTESALGLLDDSDELERARALLRRKAPVQPPQNRAERDRVARRLGAMLARRGYSPARCAALVSEVLDERAADTGCR